MLVESGGSMVNLDKYGKTPLHCAIVCGQLKVGVGWGTPRACLACSPRRQ